MGDSATMHDQVHTLADWAGEIMLFSKGQLRRDGDNEFASLVEGKQIAVVGPARTLRGVGKGEWIDSRDLVVRFNDAFTFTERSGELPVDYGIRTDILYCNQVILRKEILAGKSSRKRFAEFTRDSNLKYVVCTNNSLNFGPDGKPSPACDRNDQDVPLLFARFLAEEAPGTKFRMVHSASELLIRWLKGNWGRTGFVALIDLLSFGPVGISIMGMTFYHGGGHIATNGPELHPRGNRDGTSSISRSGFGHESTLELVILQDLMTAFGQRISIDGPLKTLTASIKRSHS